MKRFFICLICFAFIILACDEVDDSELYADPTLTIREEGEQPNVTAPETGDTWLIMFYSDADDELLEKDIFFDFNEAEFIGSSDKVHIVSQLDRFKGGFAGDGDWTSTKRFYLTQDDDLASIQSEELEDIGEVAMSEGDTLVDFVTWAVEKYPADKHALIMSDHGAGWPGGWNDPDPESNGDDNIAMSEYGDQLFLMELDKALGEIRQKTGLDKLEFIGFDACLMAHLEVFAAIAPHARYAVASQELEPAIGWAYSGFLQDLVENPEMDGRQLSQRIVETYILEDKRIVDDALREEFISEAYGFFSFLFAGETAKTLGQLFSEDVTLTAIDLNYVPDLVAALNSLTAVMTELSQDDVSQARTYAQSFYPIFEEESPSYIDLGHFADVLAANDPDNAKLDQANILLQTTLNQAVFAEMHGRQRPGSTGVSIYFPTSALYADEIAGYESYTTIAKRFAETSTWDNFLTYHFTDESFEFDEAIISMPNSVASIVAPGQGEINLSPLVLSANVATEAEPVTISTDISGQNIAYIYYFIGLYNESSNDILVIDLDFIEADDVREINGVYYPDWTLKETLLLDFEWEPLQILIDDGQEGTLALNYPETYGGTIEDARYSTEGIYTFADGAEREAIMYFNGEGQMTQVFGFNGVGGQGAPHEILPNKGDMFTVYDEWIALDEDGYETDFYQELGGTITFGNQNIEAISIPADSGEYVIGIMVEDFEGNFYEVYEDIMVE